MDSKLAKLRDVFELGISDYMFKHNGRRFCKVINECPEDQLLIDLYTKGYTSTNPRRYKKNMLIGDFSILDNCILYYHQHHNNSIISRIKNCLKDSQIKFVQLGRFLLFEDEDSLIEINSPIYLFNNKAVITKLEYTQIGGVCIPSKRSTRLFAFFRNRIYVEKKVTGTYLQASILNEYKKEDVRDMDLHMLPILYSCRYNNNSISEAEEHYSEEMVKALTK